MAQKEIMDLDEWELIPDDGFLGFREDCSEKKILYRKLSGNTNSDPKGVLNDYFNPGRLPQRVPSQLVPVPIPIPIQLNSTTAATKTRGETPDDEDVVIAGGGLIEANQDSVSNVSFKKMKKENEFVDMKMVESPKSPTRGGFNMTQIDAGVFNFDHHDKIEAENLSSGGGVITSPRFMNMKKMSGNLDMKEDHNKNMDENSDGDEDEDADDDGLNIWKWSLSGIGAICSFGIAAATICIIFIGSHHRNQQHNHKIRFQIYNDEKRMNQVVHQTSKMNEAMNAVRGMPLSRAHVTYGGYYEGL
ncbi:uncharacterized protein LOC115721825 [Cannabis sativa]|uniref:uncharacterized protein LOC115721825 n=1 Tax=Cannabis sativa TaxID=3483 RepID=UPI0029CA64AD|nr:uncharacterized protein LOC115721825 [Cannabis sativa]